MKRALALADCAGIMYAMTSATTKQDTFESAAARTLRRMREAFAAILDALPEQPRRPSEIRPALGVPQHLARRIAGIVNEEDEFLSAQHFLGERRLEAFYKAAAKKNVPNRLISAAKLAVAELDHLTEVHAGDRESLEMMLLASARKEDEDVSYSHRRSAFLANSFLWGVQAQAHLSCVIHFPSDDPQRGHAASVNGLIGLRRMRPDQPWVIGRVRGTDDQHCERKEGSSPRPIVPSDDETGGWLLRDFCSQPLPQIRCIKRGESTMEEELQASEVGNAGLMTCVRGSWLPYGVPTRQSESDQVLGNASQVRTPTELLIQDMLMHRDAPVQGEPWVKVYNDVHQLAGLAPSYEESRDVLRMGEVVTRHGPDVLETDTPEVPRYGEMVRFVCDRLGCDLNDFELFRVRIRYPVVPSNVLTAVALRK